MEFTRTSILFDEGDFCEIFFAKSISGMNVLSLILREDLRNLNNKFEIKLDNETKFTFAGVSFNEKSEYYKKLIDAIIASNLVIEVSPKSDYLGILKLSDITVELPYFGEVSADENIITFCKNEYNRQEDNTFLTDFYNRSLSYKDVINEC